MLALSLVLAAACGTSEDKASSPAASAGGTASPAAPAFTAKTLDDAAFDSATLAGKDAVLWFWAPWCARCRREAPGVAAAQSANAGVSFVGVAGFSEVAAMRTFVTDLQLGAFPHVADSDGSIWQRYGVTEQPAYAFIDNSGKVEVVRGEMGPEGFAAKVKELASS